MNQQSNSSDVSEAAPQQQGQGAPAEQEGPTVLIIEDDPVLARMYSEKFKREGFQVLTAGDGEAGLEKALKNRVNVILLDIMLPKMSGTDLLEKLRQDSKGKDITVVALTNLAEEGEKQRALQLGVKEYLVKAMQTPEQVIEKVKKYIS
ncbi:MAG: response regulator [Candidatus Woesebacteria bacterium]|jgi:two-component system alkaline phosphatase synthesis response regulator PhoP